jgi:hypothetical protein
MSTQKGVEEPFFHPSFGCGVSLDGKKIGVGCVVVAAFGYGVSALCIDWLFCYFLSFFFYSPS